MKVGIIGANGQLGMDFVQAFADGETISLTHADIEIGEIDSVSRVLSDLKPDIVIT